MGCRTTDAARINSTNNARPTVTAIPWRENMDKSYRKVKLLLTAITLEGVLSVTGIYRQLSSVVFPSGKILSALSLQTNSFCGEVLQQCFGRSRQLSFASCLRQFCGPTVLPIIALKRKPESSSKTS